MYDGLTRTNESSDIEVTRVQLRDPGYPCEVTVCFRTHRDEDVIEQWVGICHQESGPITLKKMASTSLLLTTNVYLTHFFGDWAKEMLSPITEEITPGTKVLDSKLGVRADQFRIHPLFFPSTAHPLKPTAGCWPARWNGREVFNALLMITACFGRCAGESVRLSYSLEAG